MAIETIKRTEQLRAVIQRDASTGNLRNDSVDIPNILAVCGRDMGRFSIAKALEGLEHRLFETGSIPETLAFLTRNPVDLVVIELEQHLSTALDLCRLLKRNSVTRFVPVYVIGSNQDLDKEVHALEAGADDVIVRPLRPRAFQARVQASLRHKAMIDSLDDSETVLFSLAQSVEDRDPDLGQHCHRLALMGAAMGITLGLPAEDIQALQRGGYLHDIGKVSVPDAVLFKPGPLTQSEWETMKAHTERGERICGGMKSLIPVLPIVRHHHERWDGSGYPDGLRREEIPLLARILQIADIYDALTTTRPYKTAVSPEQALAIIREEAGRGWRDPDLVALFGEILPTFRMATPASDRMHASLHALAASVDGFRRAEPFPRKSMDQAAAACEFKLASGF